MRKLLLLACLCGVASNAVASASDAARPASIHTPGPTYPAAALRANVTGTGSCEVEFDVSGHVESVAMAKSTGSKILDENTLDYARKNWTGKPNTKVLVPIVYKLAPPGKTSKGVPHVYVPRPPYPYQARAGGLQGRGTAKVSFGEDGKAISVTMVTSTGSEILDGNTIGFGMANWRSSGGKKTTVLIPVSYELR